MNTSDVIALLALQKHEEGGYYNETYRSREVIHTDREHNDGVRQLATCIYYLLSADSPIGYFHKNISPILHFYHAGGPLTYRFIHPDGSTEEHILGPDIQNGHKLQLVAPGGVWKSTELAPNTAFGLVSEVVLPGWEYYDSLIARHDDLLTAFPHLQYWIRRYSYGGES
ncbi:cupin [Brenneria corticis]|uniref:Cupin n=1 Tax=Brenneria corticis TaxID=2173106 RepID=A0A2U1TN20_9GAMM|nr:cupin [Brenneria sp. CFCC 11842]